MINIVTPQNWNHTFYESGIYKALVTFGADPESLSQGKYLYTVTVIEGERSEIHEKIYPTLSEACSQLNLLYGDWNFKDLSQTAEGCGSCVAH